MIAFKVNDLNDLELRLGKLAIPFNYVWYGAACFGVGLYNGYCDGKGIPVSEKISHAKYNLPITSMIFSGASKLLPHTWMRKKEEKDFEELSNPDSELSSIYGKDFREKMLEIKPSIIDLMKKDETRQKNTNYTKRILKNGSISALEVAAGYGIGRLASQYF
ncbi:MAG TPA: hypothetical protein VEC16_00795 [Alphaproteobacteria bacterium]|nr:hypothetical protein [Alphaproteobacteria bacterium]